MSYGKIDLGMLRPGRYRYFDGGEYTALRDYLEYIKKDHEKIQVVDEDEEDYDQ